MRCHSGLPNSIAHVLANLHVASGLENAFIHTMATCVAGAVEPPGRWQDRSISRAKRGWHHERIRRDMFGRWLAERKYVLPLPGEIEPLTALPAPLQPGYRVITH
jgi:hypothetical protein